MHILGNIWHNSSEISIHESPYYFQFLFVEVLFPIIIWKYRIIEFNLYLYFPSFFCFFFFLFVNYSSIRKSDRISLWNHRNSIFLPHSKTEWVIVDRFTIDLSFTLRLQIVNTLTTSWIWSLDSYLCLLYCKFHFSSYEILHFLINENKKMNLEASITHVFITRLLPHYSVDISY